MKKELVDRDFPDLRTLQKDFEAHEKEYSPEYLRQHAAEDAKLNIPRADSEEPSPFEQELLHEATTLASRVVAAYRRALEIIDAKIKAEEEYAAKKRQNTEELGKDLLAIENDAAENSFSLAHAHKKLEESDAHYSSLVAKYGRTPVVYVPNAVYVVFALMIFLGEIPLNALVFQIFGENQVMTWIMAVIIGLCIPLSAHFIGIKMREHGQGFSFANSFKGLLAFGIVAAALYGLAVMRQTYLGEYKEQLGLTQTLVESSFMFFWLNIAVFCTAIVMAYLAHDSVAGFYESFKDNAHTAHIVERREKERVNRLKKARVATAQMLDRANADYRDGKIRIKMMQGQYDQVLKEGQEHEARVLNILGKQLAIYRHENLRHRADDVSPKSFKTKLEFPLKLSELKEKLNNNGNLE
ncbi:MAG TPA: hypothetical protein PLP17_03745 [Oligoflexia bacterium]|nr:hypothetical protein [Oligoflexia bacterium]